MSLGQPVAEIPVRDLATARAWYAEVLGFETRWIRAEAGLAGMALGDSVLFLREVAGPVTPLTFWVFAEDVDAMYRLVTERGGEIVDPLSDKPWGMRQFTLRDPQGHLFHVHHDL